MNVIACDDSRRQDWDDFVAAAPDASFYHAYAWRTVNAREFGHRSFYLAAVDDDRIVGILPIVQLRSRLFGNIGCSMPFVNFGGAIATSDAAEEALLEAAADLVAREGMAYLELRNRIQLDRGFPTSAHKVSMTVDLSPNPDDLWNGFKTGHRQDIRRGLKHGLIVKSGTVEVLDDFYYVLSEHWRDIGTPIYSKHYFQSVIAAFPTMIDIRVVYDGSHPAAAEMSAFFRGTAEGMWLGSRAQFRKENAGYVLYWDLLRDACERGLHQYHLGRSTADSGAEAFKKKWNASPRRLYWQYMLGTSREMPRLNVNNPRFRLAINAWRHLPVRVTQGVGPLIARGIP